MADGAEQTALQAAAQAVLNRNAHIVLTLEGAPAAGARPRAPQQPCRRSQPFRLLSCPAAQRRRAAADDLARHAGLSKLRAGAPPSDAERTLFAELRDNLVALAGLLPPRLVLPAEQPPMQTFLATSRAMGAARARS